MMPSEPVANITLTTVPDEFLMIRDDSTWSQDQFHDQFHDVFSYLLFWSTLRSWPFPFPIGSMYGIYANIGGILMVNVTIYTIHGSYGFGKWDEKWPPAGDFPSEPRPAAWSKTCRWSHWTEPCRALAARSSKPFSWGCPWRTARTTALSMIDSDSMIDPSLISDDLITLYNIVVI